MKEIPRRSFRARSCSASSSSQVQMPPVGGAVDASSDAVRGAPGAEAWVARGLRAVAVCDDDGVLGGGGLHPLRPGVNLQRVVRDAAGSSEELAEDTEAEEPGDGHTTAARGTHAVLLSLVVVALVVGVENKHAQAEVLRPLCLQKR